MPDHFFIRIYKSRLFFLDLDNHVFLRTRNMGQFCLSIRYALCGLLLLCRAAASSATHHKGSILKNYSTICANSDLSPL